MGEDVLGGRYRLVRLIGRGGMGAVHEAVDTGLDRRVAVKRLLSVGGPDAASTALRRFRREAQGLARISHPGVVHVYDSGVHEGTPYIVMELLDGVGLAELVESHGPLPPPLATEVGLGMCRALAAAHAAGVLHRDVKPTNVAITRAGRVVLQDFGLARLVEEPAITQAGALIGTPQYMAPDLMRGELPGAAADLYGLGACLYLMLTGTPPLGTEAVDVGALVELAVGPGVPRLAGRAGGGLPEELARLVDALCRQDPRDRPSAAETEAALAELLDADGGRGLRELVARCVREQAVEFVYSPPALDASAPELLDWAAIPQSEPAGPDVHRPLTLSDGTRQLLLRSMTAESARSRQREAVNLVLRGDIQEAVRMITAVAQVCASALGPDHPTTLTSQYWQAVCLARLGAGAEALELFSRVNAATEHRRGRDRD
ncbi:MULTISPECIES: serine/threonine-protein kinase [Streptomyces]|uniref:non-specific serine/threonine protein kinase n=1 Tax=Streptomyces yunnanensis TaxID=156453 RepID=A0A9X8MWX9_9ACTN|nr:MULTISPECIES: serine/threonine-protein kinase [Streptomyces]SHM12747.1 Serine/threonine protein kinase [Streptomyces yunnanensis]